MGHNRQDLCPGDTDLGELLMVTRKKWAEGGPFGGSPRARTRESWEQWVVGQNRPELCYGFTDSGKLEDGVAKRGARGTRVPRLATPAGFRSAHGTSCEASPGITTVRFPGYAGELGTVGCGTQ